MLAVQVHRAASVDGSQAGMLSSRREYSNSGVMTLRGENKDIESVVTTESEKERRRKLKEMHEETIRRTRESQKRWAKRMKSR